MTAKHTPGPWNADDECQIIAGNDVIAQAFAMQFHGEDSADWDTAFANACLIAAAPELLEALRGMFNEFGELEYDLAALDKARAAIAKAEGNL